MQFVPVVDQNNRPLMPTTPSRARRWVKSGRATPFFKKGVFCVRLNVDSWVLANWFVGGHTKPENTQLIEIIPLEFHRRQLHRLQHSTGHIRSRYGGTISAGFKRGSVVKHPKFGFCYVGGWALSPTKKDPTRKTISLHSLAAGKRLTQNAISSNCKFKTYGSWRISTATKVA